MLGLEGGVGLDTPSHPRLGGLYWIDTALMTGKDPKPRRPAVVIRLAPVGLDVVTVLTRSTQVLDLHGVFHPKNPALGLTKDGVFALKHVRSLDPKYFGVQHAVEFVGDVEPSTLAQLLQLWEDG
jgi:mRNA-degrading endonuclease toxin of MazEF toxin-antitoxin module